MPLQWRSIRKNGNSHIAVIVAAVVNILCVIPLPCTIINIRQISMNSLCQLCTSLLSTRIPMFGMVWPRNVRLFFMVYCTIQLGFSLFATIPDTVYEQLNTFRLHKSRLTIIEFIIRRENDIVK